MLNNHNQLKISNFRLNHEDQSPLLNFQLQDNRCDPLVTVALKALENILIDEESSVTAPHTAIFSVTDTGCSSHVKRVVDALTKMRPRQAFFARGSAVMFSTYGSLALESHGPCLSLSGKAAAVVLALIHAKNFLSGDSPRRAILICADQVDGILKASSLLFSKSCIGELDQLLNFSLQFIATDNHAESIIQQFFSNKELI